MRKVLIIMGHYLPGYKDGGPVRSVRNLTDRLGTEYEFYILTTDRDNGDSEPYPGIKYDVWNPVGNAKVCYVKPGSFTTSLICEKSEQMDVIYLCGCFNDYARVTLILKKQRKIKCKVVIAAMGLFSPGSFHIKYWKKKLYMEGMKAAGFFRYVEWSATSKNEIGDIRKIVGDNAVCHLAQDIPQQIEKMPVVTEKKEGELKAVFLSRISREKNLDYALDILQKVKGHITFDVYGTKEDEEYFKECVQKAEKLPENIKCTYKGKVMPENVIDVFAQYHVFFFPTRGENYGHVIFEALAGGCIPLISDRTPWFEIEEKSIGWTLPLENEKIFIEVLQSLVDMDADVCADMQQKAAEYAQEYSRRVDCQGYRDIFDR